MEKQFSLNIYTFDETKELVQFLGDKIGSWSLNYNIGADCFKLTFKSRYDLDTLGRILHNGNFHLEIKED